MKRLYIAPGELSTAKPYFRPAKYAAAKQRKLTIIMVAPGGKLKMNERSSPRTTERTEQAAAKKIVERKLPES